MRSKVFKDFNDLKVLKVLNESAPARLFVIWLRPIYFRSVILK